MKARTKILLLITIFAIVTALCFSIVILWEFYEQPVRIIDRELYEITEQLQDIIPDPHLGGSGKIASFSSHLYRQFAVAVFSDEKNLSWKTPLAEKVDFQFRADGRYYYDSAVVGRNDLALNQHDRNEIRDFSGQRILFRVYNTIITVKGARLKVIVARPIPVLIHEIRELVTGLLYSLAICLLVVPIVGFFIANRILKPITVINRQIKEITSSSLHQRIPVGKNRDELQLLSESLNQMFDRLEFSFDRQKEFIGNASHDLKSPLTILMLSQEKLLSEALPEHVEAALVKQLNTTRRVSRLVYNLLELSRLEQQDSFNETEVQLDATITNLLDEFEELIAERNIEVSLHCESVRIQGDQEKIARVIINLLDNAIKYNSQTGGQIDISLVKQKEWAVIEIANTGSSIPEESLPHLFDQFYRVEKSRSSEYGGSGLGLTIVKHIVELHKGQITVHNSPAGKIVFTIHLPV